MNACKNYATRRAYPLLGPMEAMVLREASIWSWKSLMRFSDRSLQEPAYQHATHRCTRYISRQMVITAAVRHEGKHDAGGGKPAAGHREAGNAHLAADELQPPVDVHLGLVHRLANQHWTHQLVHICARLELVKLL
jgi:hypothetical protein